MINQESAVAKTYCSDGRPFRSVSQQRQMVRIMAGVNCDCQLSGRSESQSQLGSAAESGMEWNLGVNGDCEWRQGCACSYLLQKVDDTECGLVAADNAVMA